MRRKRIINAIIWAVIAIVLNTLVCVEWYNAGCCFLAFLAAAGYYSGVALVIGLIIDQAIKDYYQNV
ncbi:MAG: hypothetical protein IKN59_01695 [Paludibacteraceae bacterium]|nr:hypothetical protein [Paludibacteraceae bacterium]